MEDMREPVVVAALEIGTTNASLAWSFGKDFKRDPLKVRSFIWHSPELSFKTPTCILLDKKKQCVAFGYDAEKGYTELVMDEEQDDYYFFDRFTLSLHNNENVTRNMVLKDKTGKQCSAVEVFTLSIEFFVAHLMDQLGKTDVGLSDDNILWVLTVPAAWHDSGKQLMRESAEKAGLKAEHVLLITEPEAAFTYCHYISTARLQESKHGIMITDPGTTSMVVDLRDMAADITVLQQTCNGQLKVLCRATGDDCGGASVGDRFCNVFEEIFGRNVITELNRKEPIAWLDMLRNFRRKIENFTTSNTKLMTLHPPSSLNEICEELHGNDLKSAIYSSSYMNDITICNTQTLRFKADLIIKLLTPTIDSIITLMKNTVSNRSTNGVSNNVSNIAMVGGLSECPMIQDAVYKAFPDNQIIIPVNADFSVLNGAVLFGHRPDYIWSELRDEEGIGK